VGRSRTWNETERDTSRLRGRLGGRRGIESLTFCLSLSQAKILFAHECSMHSLLHLHSFFFPSCTAVVSPPPHFPVRPTWSPFFLFVSYVVVSARFLLTSTCFFWGSRNSLSSFSLSHTHLCILGINHGSHSPHNPPPLFFVLPPHSLLQRLSTCCTCVFYRSSTDPELPCGPFLSFISLPTLHVSIKYTHIVFSLQPLFFFFFSSVINPPSLPTLLPFLAPIYTVSVGPIKKKKKKGKKKKKEGGARE